MDKETAQLAFMFLKRVDIKWDEQQAAAKVTNALIAVIQEADEVAIRERAELLKSDTSRGPYEPLTGRDNQGSLLSKYGEKN